jgi:GTP-binding protein
MFVDEHVIIVRGGKGGDGLASFRRESRMPKGGPDGGDGGDGGDVIFVASHHLNGLGHLQMTREIRAKDGGKGLPSDCAGKNAQDTTVEVPVGTVVHELVGEAPPEPEPVVDDGEIHAPDEAFGAEGARGESYAEPEPEYSSRVLVDLDTPGKTYIVAHGGNGGFGNKHFASATNQSPRQANPGRPGEVRRLKLEVKLIADVGLVGLPNAGKSTLLARCTRARPKIAAYPFTTLSPYLGIVDMQGESRFVMADIPGLIEGASRGKGLGHQFLRHVERTRLLLHLVDVSESEPEQLKRDYDVIAGELEAFSPELA